MSASTTMKASDEVLAVLRNAIIDEEGLTLQGQLSQADYKAVNKFLEAAGAKWNRGAKRHLFTGNAKAEIEGLLGTGKIVHKKNLYQSFYTPKDIAQRLVSLAGVTSIHKCLEPSAGHGVIARAIEAKHAKVVCVDIDPSAVRQLALQLIPVHAKDFLECTAGELDGPFDRVVMNPPFTKNQAFKHVIHAHSMLRDGGVLAAIVPASTPTGKALREDWENLIVTSGEYLEELPEGTFKESGTGVRTQIVRIVK